VRWIRDQIDELDVLLSRPEEDAVATVIAGILWAASQSAPAQAEVALAAP
jgi:hypothetical protein